MFNIRPDLRLMGFPFQPQAEEVPGLGPKGLALMRAATEPGAELDPIESVNAFTPPSSASGLPFLPPNSHYGPYGPISLGPGLAGQSRPSYAPTNIAAALTQPSLDSRIERQPGIKPVPETPSQPPILGIHPNLMRDPLYQPPIHIEVPGEVPPRIEYWPRRR